MVPSSPLFEHVYVVSRLGAEMLRVAVVVIVAARIHHCFPAGPHCRSLEVADARKAWFAV